MADPKTSETARQLPADCVELFARRLHAFAAVVGPDGKLPLPKWVHLSPAGEEGHERAKKGERVVRGRDGREFAIGDAMRVIAGTELPMQFDWDHESVSWFGSTKAAAWIDQIVFLEEGDEERPAAGFWGRVERWTPEGKSDVEEARYRGLSPVVRYEYREPGASGEPPPPPLLIGFVNVALTNRPNLKMTLLNREEQSAASRPTNGDRRMTFASRRERAIERALADKRITNAAWWRLAIQDDAALERFERDYGVTPTTSPKSSPAPSDQETVEAFARQALTDDERAMARKMGVTEAEYRAAKLDTAARAAEFHGTGDAAHLRSAAKVALEDAKSETQHGSTGELTDDERAMARKMGVTDAEYAAAKAEGL